jgi:hypothetical protein
MLTNPGSAFKEPPRATRHDTPIAINALMFNLMVAKDYTVQLPSSTLISEHQVVLLEKWHDYFGD